MSAVGMPLLSPDQTDIIDLPGVHALAEHLALRRPRVERDAELAPAVADQLEHVGFLGALAGGVDDDLQRPARRASGASRGASRAVRPISSSSAFAALRSNFVQASR